MADASISQAGDRVAILGGSAGARTVDIAPIDGDRTVNVPLGAAQVRELRWAGDDYLLLRTANYLQIPQGEAYTFERHVVVDRQGRPVSRLLSNSPMSEYATGLPILTTAGEPRPTAHVLGLDWRPSDRTPNTRLRYNDNELVATVWRVDVASGRGQIVDRGNASTRYFQVDRSGGPRVRLDVNPFDGVETLFGRAKGASSWRQLAQTRDQDDLGFLGYSDADDSLLFVRPGEGGGSRIVRVALADGAETVVAEPAWPDAQVLWDEVRMQPVAVYGGVERRRYQWLDPALGRAQATLERAFRGREVTLWSWNAERTRVVARVQSRDAPPTWHLLDTAARSVSALGEAYPELSGARLGTTRWITYRARDGLEIPAWVTMPPGAPASGGRLPLIVLPHGGPAANDDSGFDWWAQFLATRGYVVIQPQFRGSDGFGRAFREAGERKWGGKVQTDLLDGIAHLAAGTIDPARVCVAGASFGGYSALAGVALNPAAYRCAVSVARVADLPAMLGQTQRSDGEDSSALRYWRRVMGASDRRLLEVSSPARRAAEIRAPVLLIHGRHDTTVPYAQSELMQRAMTAAGRPVQLVALETDDHYLSTSATRTRMLEALDGFLREHLPVGPPAAASRP